MSRWLQRQVDQEGVPSNDIWLYNSTITSFRRQYADILQEEKARANIMKGIKMNPEDPDGYIAKFEEMVHHTGYNINDPLTIGHYTKGLPTGLYETIYQFDNPQTFEAWREATLRRQSQWFHMQVRKNLDKFQNSPRRSNPGHRTFQIPGRHPDAMDTSADRSHAHITQTTQDEPNNPFIPRGGRGRGGIPPPRGGFLARGGRPNFTNITCYVCRQQGHIARYCPQHRWNQPGGSKTHFTQAHDYYEQEEPIQVARTVADTRNPQQKAQDWLNGVAGESDEVKDMVLQQLWKKEDFQNT